MEKVLNALKCVNCQKNLSSPIVLPCGHTICKSHADVIEEQIVCSKCGTSHSNNGFVVSEALSALIEAQIGNLDFGPLHTESTKSCDLLRKQLDDNEIILKDLDYVIHEAIDELKNKVLLKSEQYKVAIDEITLKLIDDLNEYEKRCKNRHNEESKSKQDFLTLIDELKKQNETANDCWNEWSTFLNNLKVDESKWKKIKEDSDKTLSDMNEKLKHFKKELLLNEYETILDSIDIFSDLSLKKPIQSRILNCNLITQFLDLCKFKDNQKFNLLYRASRDGFKGASFHSKCDDRPKTISIFQTTRGHIFGGYTNVKWSCKGDYCYDDKAFLFSLVNRFGKPFLCKIATPRHAVYCHSDYGPTFGASQDIYTTFTSPSPVYCYVKLGSYTPPGDIIDDRGYYFTECRSEVVEEIEVFQI